MSNPAVAIIQDGVGRITVGMSEGRFTKEELETVKKIFEAGIASTERCLARGPKKGMDQ